VRRPLESLSGKLIETVLPDTKPIKLFDGAGLYLLVNVNGSKLWRFKYRYQGKEKLLSFGRYPEVSLDDARVMRSDAKQMLKDGLDPSVTRKMESNLELAERTKPYQGVSVRVHIDGGFEIWKGRLAIHLSADEACFVRDQLSKLMV